jgi:hypothetical protein
MRDVPIDALVHAQLSLLEHEKPRLLVEEYVAFLDEDITAFETDWPEGIH